MSRKNGSRKDLKPERWGRSNKEVRNFLKALEGTTRTTKAIGLKR